VPVTEVVPRATSVSPAGKLKLTVNAVCPSNSVGDRICTLKVAVLLPVGIVTLLVAAVYSVPATAVSPTAPVA